MREIGNWIVTADIGGLTYAWKVFDCTAQQAVFCVRRKYPNVENVKVEKALVGIHRRNARKPKTLGLGGIA